MFQSGFHRLTFFYAVACVAAWFYLFNQWVGLWLAILACIPVGCVTTLAYPMLIGTLRQCGLGDAFVTWASIAVGIVVCFWAFASYTGTARVLMLLAGSTPLVGGVGLLQLRMNAMRLRRQMGLLDPADAAFLDDLDAARGKRIEPWAP